MASPFVKLVKKDFGVTKVDESRETKKWRQFKHADVTELPGAVNHVTFKPVTPFDFAITSGTRVRTF